MSRFDDDLTVSLDRAYIEAHRGNLTACGGKFANPLSSTDLLWDGDVNPQGIAGRWQSELGPSVSASLNMLYFIIDENVAGKDSDMIGAQAALDLTLGGALSANLALGYLDFSLASVGGANLGDFRGNRLTSDGTYLSDYDIGDILLSMRYDGLGDRWPLNLAGHYVKNFGAIDNRDSGFMFAGSVGETSKRDDWNFGYSYSTVEQDGVLAAFSNDNIALSTGYFLHALSASFVPREQITLNATFYHYRARDFRVDDWQNRLRLNAMFTF